MCTILKTWNELIKVSPILRTRCLESIHFRYKQKMEYEEEKLTEGLVLAKTRAVDLDGVTKLNFWYV